MKRIDCRKCENYYVTWEKKTPHGCTAMGFKSQVIPSAVVFRNTGHSCILFEPKVRRVKDIDTESETQD